MLLFEFSFFASLPFEIIRTYQGEKSEQTATERNIKWTGSCWMLTHAAMLYLPQNKRGTFSLLIMSISKWWNSSEIEFQVFRLMFLFQAHFILRFYALASDLGIARKKVDNVYETLSFLSAAKIDNSALLTCCRWKLRASELEWNFTSFSNCHEIVMRMTFQLRIRIHNNSSRTKIDARQAHQNHVKSQLKVSSEIQVKSWQQRTFLVFIMFTLTKFSLTVWTSFESSTWWNLLRFELLRARTC